MNQQMKFEGAECLVLGAGGFIGTNLCRHLLRQGARVRGFGRAPRDPSALLGVAWQEDEFSDTPALARAVAGSRFIFHLIGSSLPNNANQDPAADLSVNVLQTLALLELCRAEPHTKVTFVSSGGTVYGIPRAVPIAEESLTDPTTAYGIGKLAIEKYLALYHRLHGIDYTILRLANPFGPFQSQHRGQGLIAALLHRALSGELLEIWGDGEIVRDFVYIDDAIEAISAAALYDGPFRLFNVGRGIGRSINQVVADIETLLGRGQLHKLHKAARATDVPVNVLDIALIAREMGWHPRTEWKDALQKTLEWCRAAVSGESNGRRTISL